MLVSSISTLLIGMLLGLRFKVLIVAPASLGAMLFAICVGIMHADVPWKIGLSAAAAIACLQVGYVAGIVILSRLGSGLVPGYNSPSTRVRHAVQKSPRTERQGSGHSPAGQLENICRRGACLELRGDLATNADPRKLWQ